MATCNGQLSAPRLRPPPRSSLALNIVQSYALLWLGTLLAVAIALPLAGQLRELFHLRLRLAPAGTPGVAVQLASNNVRVAAVPLLFAALRATGLRSLRALCDAGVGASLATNVAIAGLALGAYGPALLRYLPHWPLEWGGLALALTGWRRARCGEGGGCELILLAIGAATLLCAAALLETYAVPQGGAS